jgi:hypothetical protein
MTRETDKAAKASLTVKMPGTIADGKDGFLAVGDKFEPVDAAAKKSLVDKGFAA